MDKNNAIISIDNKIPQKNKKIVVVAKKKTDEVSVILEQAGSALVKNINENSKAYSDTFNSILTLVRKANLFVRLLA